MGEDLTWQGIFSYFITRKTVVALVDSALLHPCLEQLRSRISPLIINLLSQSKRGDNPLSLLNTAFHFVGDNYILRGFVEWDVPVVK